jgi:hypothetical protein
MTKSTDLNAAIQEFRDYIAQETLANKIISEPLPAMEPVNATLAGDQLAVYVRVAK